MIRITATLLLAVTSACGVQENTAQEPVLREQELARNDVWHKAKLRGVAFRAIGQEPGWLVEIKNGEEILVVIHYGQIKRSYAYVEPQEDKAARKTVFQIDTDTSLLIEGKPCTDSMSGESFDVAVTLKTGIQTLTGCGRALF